MRRCSECGADLADDARFCPSCGAAAPGDDVVEAAPAGDKPTVVERLLQGDWRGAAVAAAVALLTAYVAAEVALTSLLTGADRTTDVGNPPVAWLRAAAGLVGMAFGSPISMTTSGDPSDPDVGRNSVGLAPLALTLLTLLVLYLALRRTARGDATRQENVMHAVRAVLLFAVGVAVVTAFARVTNGTGTDRQTLSASWLSALFWAALGGGVAAVAALGLWRRAVPDALRGALDDWWLAARGGLVGLATGVAISGVVAVVLAFGYADDAEAAVNVAKALPLIAAFFVNIGVTAFGVATGGRAGFAVFDETYFSVFHRHGESAFYLLLLLVPVVSVAVAVRWVARHRGERSDRDTVRACYRTAASATLAWFVLALLGQVRFDVGLFGVHGASSAGPSIGWGLLLVPLWFVVLGYAFGRLAVERYPAVAHAPRRWPSVDPVRAVVALAIAAVALGAVAAVALHDADDAEAEERLPRGSATTTVRIGDPEAVARAAGAAEESYHSIHGEYTDTAAALEPFGVEQDDDVTLVFVRATTDDLCLVAYAGADSWTYSHADGLQEGTSCV